MIKELEAAGYTVERVSGGPLTDEEIAAANADGIYYVGQEGIPEPYEGEDSETGETLTINMRILPRPAEREQIVRVTGHGVDTTIYTHDEESIADLLSNIDEPHPRYAEA